jgi:hypothetical protein
VLDREGPDDLPEPVIATKPDDAPAGPLLIRIPEDYRTMREADAPLADRWREAVAATLGELVTSGRIVQGFTTTAAYVVD